MLEQNVLIYQTLSECAVVARSTSWFGPDTEKPRRPNRSVLAAHAARPGRRGQQSEIKVVN